MAKAINNAAAPMGAVAADRRIYDTIVNASAPGAIELFHGYTYSAHPIAAAAAVATQDLYQRERLFERTAKIAPFFENAIHTLRDAPYVKDVRNLGLVGGVELESRDGAFGMRAYEAFVKCFELGVLVRYTGDTLAFSPPLIISEQQVTQIFDTVRNALQTLK